MNLEDFKKQIEHPIRWGKDFDEEISPLDLLTVKTCVSKIAKNINKNFICFFKKILV